MLVRRPVSLLFLMACNVSLWASGSFSLRLIVDGAISFAFVPLFSVAALWIVYAIGPRPIAFKRAVDLFFDGNPWVVWLIGFMFLRCFMTPMQTAAPPVSLVRAVELSFVLCALMSLRRDHRFFRDVLQRHAARDLIVQRAISWVAIVAWFVGPAALPYLYK